MQRRTLILVLMGTSALTWAGGPIITSDGPGTGGHRDIVISNGPADVSAILKPVIIITDGSPAYLQQAKQAKHGGLMISDGPGMETAETSTLAPMVPMQDPPPAFPAQIKTPAPVARSLPALQHTAAPREKSPFYVYSDKQSSGNHFFASGWMGDFGDLRLDENFREKPHSGNTCIKISYSAEGSQGAGWAGIYWQFSAGNWGNRPGGYDLSGYRRLTFWARGAKGNEVISEFKMGGISGENSDSASASTGSIVLSKEWQKYTLGLSSQNLSHVIGGFCWTASRQDNPNGATFYLDDIRYE